MQSVLTPLNISIHDILIADIVTCPQANEADQVLLERRQCIPQLVDLFGTRVRRQESDGVTLRYELRSSRHLHIDLARGRVRQKGNVHVGGELSEAQQLPGPGAP